VGCSFFCALLPGLSARSPTPCRASTKLRRWPTQISFARFVRQQRPHGPPVTTTSAAATADTDTDTTAQSPQAQAPDLEALIAFYVTTQGTQWSNREGWLCDEDIQ
jgi:hypothetical protein